MIRFTLIELALVATPLLAFLTWRALFGRRRGAGGGDDTIYAVLLLLGAIGAVAALATAVILSEDAPTDRNETVYIPPRTVDGHVIPGRVMPREEAIRLGLIEDAQAAPETAAAPDPETPS